MTQVTLQHVTILLRFAEVSRRTGLSRSTIDRLERIGKFPPRRKLGARAVGWCEQEIYRWHSARPVRVVISDASESVSAQGWSK